MTWSDFYLICFFLGFVLSVLSLLGSLHLHLPHFDSTSEGIMRMLPTRAEVTRVKLRRLILAPSRLFSHGSAARVI